MVTTDTILDSYLPLDAAEFANFFHFIIYVYSDCSCVYEIDCKDMIFEKCLKKLSLEFTIL